MYTRTTAAVFGLGQAGKIHFKNILNNTRIDLKYIVEERTGDAEKFIADYRLPGTRVVHSSELQRVLDDEALQACFVATPTDSHEMLILASLKAGKAVFCEKPLANSVEAIGNVLYCREYVIE